MDILIDILFPAIDEFNTNQPNDQKLKKSRDAMLLGNESHLDSVQLVAFIVTVEEILLEKIGKDIPLITTNAMTQSDDPFSTINNLRKYIEDVLLCPEAL